MTKKLSVEEIKKKKHDASREYRLAHPEKMRQYRRKYYLAHKDDISARHLAFNEKHRLKNRERFFKRVYGLTYKDIDAMIASQGGLCKICSRPPREGKKLCVDHDHENDHIRGLICDDCNLGLARFHDNPKDLRSAADYLDGGLALAENERLCKLDDPVFDATDAAHPAWWRGEKYGSQQAARKVRKILDGGDDGTGMSSDPDLEKIRRDILALKADNERLKRERDLDYKDMRKFQEKYIKADHELREMGEENERLKKLTTMTEPQAKHHPGDPPWPTEPRKVWVLVYDYDRLKAENSRLSRYEKALLRFIRPKV